MSDAYCGVGKVPKGKRRGSMKQCAEAGQIRYYGIKKVDKRTLAGAKSGRKKKGSKEKVRGQFVTLKVKRKKLFEAVKAEKNKKKKEKLKTEWKKVTKELEQIQKQLKKMSRGKKRSSKKRSKKRSKRRSKKRSKKKSKKRSSKKRIRRKYSNKKRSRK